eukprot:TRINITY_DN1029_c0_g1_i1.p2 TRINITY_DN1029_c0_g1~~TRINITY_DN1029_c0_g1_i1.p2  ORF type:complete len:173 (-),score=10.36 TRINITY_DN1029_c0_g1_i1:263-781(-)
MYTIWVRLNAVFTVASTALAVMCALVSLTDFFHKSDPKIDLRINNYDALYKKPRGDDAAFVQLDLNADLRSVFTWNTKQLFVFIAAEYETDLNRLNQIVLWDRIITYKDAAYVKSKVRQKYHFEDQGANLRGKEFNLTLVWNVMPKVGLLFEQKETFTGFKFSDEYIGRPRS